MRFGIVVMAAAIVLFTSCTCCHRGKNSPIVKHYTAFTVRYNPKTLQPDWAEYTLTAEQVQKTGQGAAPLPKHNLKPDPEINLRQASNKDYEGVYVKYGLEKGHMARRMDMKISKEAVRESDYFTNISPQHRSLNHGVWATIEDRVRDLAVLYDSVHIVCGPVISDCPKLTIGPRSLPVPEYFFKTLLVSRGGVYYSIAFLCANDDVFQDVPSVACTVNDIEDRTGFDFYSYIDDSVEEIIESECNLDIFF